jgi:hypothetical protein
MKALTVVLVATLGAGCATSEDVADEDASLGFGDGKEDGATTGYVSASSVASLWQRRDPAAVVARSNPPFETTFPNDDLAAWEYLKPIGSLGMYGPLGPYGSLGRGGPVGFRVYNPSTSIELVGLAIEAYGTWLDAIEKWYAAFEPFGDMTWHLMRQQLEQQNEWLKSWRYDSKILSADGPLASGGPLNPQSWKGSDLIVQLSPGGMLAPLGPVGPLGALGPLGPLGPTTPLVTFQGYQENLEGEFVPGLNGCFRPADAREHGVKVCRTLLVPWTTQSTECTAESANCRRYELYENYDEAFAQQMTDNDTSFMVAGTTTEGSEDVYPFHSRDAQFVTVVLAPEEKPLWDLTALQSLLIAAGHVPGNPRFTRKMRYMPEAIETYPGAWSAFYDHETAFDDFDLVVELDGKTYTSTTSGHYGMVEWVQIKVPAGATLRAHVTLANRRIGIPGNPDAFTLPEAHYRLFVTGSTKYAPAVVMSGPQFVAPTN